MRWFTGEANEDDEDEEEDEDYDEEDEDEDDDEHDDDDDEVSDAHRVSDILPAHTMKPCSQLPDFQWRSQMACNVAVADCTGQDVAKRCVTVL